MPSYTDNAKYPGEVVTTTVLSEKATGDVIGSSHMNAVQAEIVQIENTLGLGYGTLGTSTAILLGKNSSGTATDYKLSGGLAKRLSDVDVSLDLYRAHSAASDGVHGLTGAGNNVVGTSATQTLTNKTVSGGTVSGTVTFSATASGTGSLSISSINATTALTKNNIDVVTVSDTQTLTNKTLTSPVLTSPSFSTIVNTGTLTLPTSTDTLVGRATTDTLTNKTLTSPVIATIVNTGTLTLPTSTDTLVARATTDTLTNKTMSGASNTFSSIPQSAITSLVSDLALKSPLASPTFTGTPVAPTAVADTNTTQIATTAFVIGQRATVAPIMDSTAAVGTSNKYAREDHVHPTDTSRAPVASPSFTGTPAAPTAAADTNTTQLATTAFVIGQASSSTPSMDGTAGIGTSLRFARADHVHPTDTSRSPVASPTFTGTVTLPLVTAGYVKTSSSGVISSSAAVPQSDVTNLVSNLADKAPSASPTFTGTVTLPLTTAGYVKTTSLGVISSSSAIPQSDVTNLVSNLADKAPLASPTFTGTVTTPLTTAGYVKTSSGGVLSSSSSVPQADVTNLTTDLASKIAKAVVTAKGDLLVATASATVDRQAIGTNNQRLVADSVQTTGLKWVSDTTNYAVAAKGDLLVGTAASTVAPLTVGSNNAVLVADSTVATTGMKWATTLSGLTLSSPTISGGTVSSTINSASISVSDVPVVTTTGSQTLTNKQLGSGITIGSGVTVTSSGTISGGTIAGATLSGTTTLASGATISGGTLSGVAISGSSNTLSSIAFSSIPGLQTALDGKQPLDADLTSIAALTGTTGFLKKTAADTWELDTTSYIAGNQQITLTGDVSGFGSTSINVTLAASGVTAGTYNDSATAVRPLIVDAKGRVTGVGTAVTITPAWSSITGKPTATGTGSLVFSDSPTFTGVPLAPTATAGTNTTQVATTAYVRSEISALVNSAPSSLDTLNELATALGNDPNFATTVTNSIATKAPSASPTFTGTVTLPLTTAGYVKTTSLGVVSSSSAIPQSDVTGLGTSLASKAALTSPEFNGTPLAPTASTSTENTQIATTAYVLDKINQQSFVTGFLMAGL